jgi:hypothetical protein
MASLFPDRFYTAGVASRAMRFSAPFAVGVSSMPKKRASRGRNKPSLRDLPHQMPTDIEFERLIADMDALDARAAALIMGALIDNLLEYAIFHNFVDLTEPQFNSLFRDPTAPLTSFAAKTALAHALGVFGNEFKKQLDTVRAIRNTFAHTILPIDFDHPPVSAKCRDLDPSRLTDHTYQAETDSPRERFTTVANMIATHLIRYNRRPSDF